MAQSTGKPARNDSVDHASLHYILWTRTHANSKRVLAIHQQDLADELRVNKYTMSRVLKAMVGDGRLEPLPGSGEGRNVTEYIVTDPLDFTDGTGP